CFGGGVLRDGGERKRENAENEEKPKQKQAILHELFSVYIRFIQYVAERHFRYFYVYNPLSVRVSIQMIMHVIIESNRCHLTKVKNSSSPNVVQPSYQFGLK